MLWMLVASGALFFILGDLGQLLDTFNGFLLAIGVEFGESIYQLYLSFGETVSIIMHDRLKGKIVDFFCADTGIKSRTIRLINLSFYIIEKFTKMNAKKFCNLHQLRHRRFDNTSFIFGNSGTIYP